MAVNFDGKSALVTGAGKGIGRAIAVKLVELGAKVFGISRTQADLDELKAEVPSIEVRLVDIADWDKTRQIVEDMGPIDLLVNNAGITNWTSFLDVKKEEFDNLHDINFKAAFNISQAFASAEFSFNSRNGGLVEIGPVVSDEKEIINDDGQTSEKLICAQVVAKEMVSRGTGGSIVNISSIAGFRAVPNHTLYCSAKAALDMLSMTLALELGPHKIRVNSVNPTIVMTELGKRGWSDPVKRAKAFSKIPIGRFAEEEDVVNATIFLLSDQSSMISGITMPVDGGMTIGLI